MLFRSEILALIKRHEGETGIVYCLSRKAVEQTATFLTSNGVRARPYHAGMESEARERNQEAFQHDEIDVIVLKYDPATERVSLGYKQLHADPWASVDQRYPVGQRLNGKVVSLTDYGALVELEPGVEGLIQDRKSTRLNSSHSQQSRMPSSA